MAKFLHSLAKLLEGLGLIVILVGLVMSVQLGMNDDGLESMTSEAYGLAIGGGMCLAGWALERAIGSRS